MFLSILHKHEWGEWVYTNKHAWSHAVTMFRNCQSCYADEYKLIELNCPQYKIRKKYCHWCEQYADEWEKRLKTMDFMVLDRKTDIPYTHLMEQYKRGKTAEAMTDRNRELYKFILEGHTYQEASDKFNVSRARAFELYRKFEKKMEKVA